MKLTQRYKYWAITLYWRGNGYRNNYRTCISLMKDIKDKFLSYSVDKDGVALIEINQKEEPANLLTLDFITRYFEIAKIAIEDKM